MENYFGGSKTVSTSSERPFGRFGGPSSAFMSWSSIKPFYDPTYLPFGVTDLNSDFKETATKHFPFKDILDTSPPMTSVFMGLMQRRKRRENRPRRQRTTFTSEQTLKLELEYNRTEYISRPRRYEIAKLLNLTENQIKIWFQNRRAKEKRIEKAHIDQQIRTSAISNGADSVPVSTAAYPLSNPYIWPYTPATFNRLLPESEKNQQKV